MVTTHTDIPRDANDLTSTVCADIIHRVLNDGPVEVPIRQYHDLVAARARLHKAALAQTEPIEIGTVLGQHDQKLVVKRYL